MLSGRPQVSVIVPTLNRPKSLQRCLDSLLKQSYKDFEIIVVDGGSGDASPTLERYPVVIIRQNKAGHVHAYNLGVKNAKGRTVAFIDDDAWANENWLLNIVKTYQKVKSAGAVGGKVIDVGYKTKTDVRNFHSRPMLSLFAKVYETIVLENKGERIGYVCQSGAVTSNLDRGSTIIEIDSPRGVNMSFRKDILLRIGLFDEGYKFHANLFETDAFTRVKKSGFKVVYNPSATVYHKVRARYALKGTAYNEVRFFFKNFDWWKPNYLFRFILKEMFWFFYWLNKLSQTKEKEYLSSLYERIIAFTTISRCIVSK